MRLEVRDSCARPRHSTPAAPRFAITACIALSKFLRSSSLSSSSGSLELVSSSSTGKFEPPFHAASGCRPSPHGSASALSSFFSGSPALIGKADSAPICLLNPSAARRTTMVSADFSNRIAPPLEGASSMARSEISPGNAHSLLH